METNGLRRWADVLWRVALGVAACQVVAALGVAVLPPPASSEGGPIAALLYAGYYVVPLTLLAFGLRSDQRIIIALVAIFALALVVLHSAPLLNVDFPFQGQPWQRTLALLLSALSGLIEAMIFMVAVATLIVRRDRAGELH